MHRRDGLHSLPSGALAAAAFVCVAAMLLALGLALAAGRASGATSGLTEAEAEQIGLQAYVYGFPLVEFEAQTETATSVTVPTDAGAAPVNELASTTNLATPSETAVVQPNNDTLYSGAHLDLSNGPLVLHVPRLGADRYYSFEFLDPYTNVFAYVGTRTTGDGSHNFVIEGPGFHGRLLRRLHLRVVRSRYNLVWMVGRTLVLGSSDLSAAHKIQTEDDLLPLSDFTKHGLRWHWPAPSQQVTTPTYHALPAGLAFFDELGEALKESPPPAADASILATLRAVGIGPGLEPSQENLSSAIVAGLTDAAADGLNDIDQIKQQIVQPSVQSTHGWFVPPSNTGDYGTDYDLRAVIAADGLGANRPAEAMYVSGLDDSDLKPLIGLNTYTIHFPAGQLPPARFFWSLTMYDSRFYLVPNSLNRYEIGNRTSGLQYNSDGSLDIYLSHRPPPEGQSNWLPAPLGQFEVTLRLYGPSSSALDGDYQYPPIIEASSLLNKLR